MSIHSVATQTALRLKLGAGKGNVFYGCYSWENSDDGWDSYDKDSLTYNLTYTNCACWNNGDPTIFTLGNTIIITEMRWIRIYF